MLWLNSYVLLDPLNLRLLRVHVIFGLPFCKVKKCDFRKKTWCLFWHQEVFLFWVMVNGLLWRTFIRFHSKNKFSFLYTPFWTIFLVKKKTSQKLKFRPINLTLICNIKTLFPFFYYQNQKGTSKWICARNISA